MASPRTADVFLIGHSLVSHEIPDAMRTFNKQIDATNGAQTVGDVDYQIIIGSPLGNNWRDAASDWVQGTNSKAALATGKYDVLIMTEAVPLDTHIEWSDPAGNALKFLKLAHSANPGVQAYIYETWHGFGFFNNNLQAWRKGLDSYLPKWEGIVDGINAGRPAGSKEALLIPGGQAMAQLYDAIEAGRVPGITSIRQMFVDDIHPNINGFYFIALLHDAVVYGGNPQGYSNIIKGTYGDYAAVPPALAKALADLAWNVVKSYDRDGVEDGGTTPTDPTGPVDPDDVITGTAGDDRISGTAGHDTIKGLSGNDVINGLNGNDLLYGGDGNDQLNGGAGNDTLRGEAGNDRLTGGDGNDVLDGGDGNDRLNGGAGDDTMLGGSGDDFIFAGLGRDVIDGGAGVDRVDFAAATGGVSVNLTTGVISGSASGTLTNVENILGSAFNDTLTGDSGANTIWGQAGNDQISLGAGNDRGFGGAGNDIISGGAGNDLLQGNEGNDTLNGDAGNDQLNGGDGNDVLTGGAGNDVLIGGAGNDVFVFDRDSGVDTIRDFEVGTDTVMLDLGGGDVMTWSLKGSVATLNYGSGSIRFEGIDRAEFVELQHDLVIM